LFLLVVVVTVQDGIKAAVPLALEGEGEVDLFLTKITLLLHQEPPIHLPWVEAQAVSLLLLQLPLLLVVVMLSIFLKAQVELEELVTVAATEDVVLTHFQGRQAEAAALAAMQVKVVMVVVKEQGQPVLSPVQVVEAEEDTLQAVAVLDCLAKAQMVPQETLISVVTVAEGLEEQTEPLLEVEHTGGAAPEEPLLPVLFLRVQ
jgi:hypothetical protein